MKRRGDKISALDALQGLGQLSDLAELTSAAADEVAGGVGVVALPLRDLVPDPTQARRVLPAGVRNRFLAAELSPVQALVAWQELAAADPVEAEVLETRVVRLARSLQAQEQINPITVSRLPAGMHEPPRFLIETGERRWWAHWWLVGVEHNEQFQTIQAVVIDQASPWRQAAENLQGEPLSAVQEACQVARLVLLEAGVEPVYRLTWTEGAAAVEMEEAGDGYGFYRRVLVSRVPPGAWPRIEQATGKGRRYCQYLLGMLRLGDEALEMADRAGLTESQLRPLAAGEEDEERQQRIVQLATRYELGRDDVATLVRTDDLEAAARQLEAGQEVESRRPPVIRPPERIVLDRLAAMTRLLDRASRSEPAMMQVVAQELRRAADVERRLAELAGLRTFLTALLEAMEREGDA